MESKGIFLFSLGLFRGNFTQLTYNRIVRSEFFPNEFHFQFLFHLPLHSEALTILFSFSF
ncbi:hypothetical protein DLM78_06110 [Leptospira stimsonii]|uniref:Uncharacterized protein n=1 Tax=Leptospira stimsonii TaxID=2202203 RepID=A0A8B3CXG1_9LEPT|nr:hypothetical protein DLM78_06110 [Leptospira stimsonii]